MAERIDAFLKKFSWKSKNSFILFLLGIILIGASFLLQYTDFYKEWARVTPRLEGWVSSFQSYLGLILLGLMIRPMADFVLGAETPPAPSPATVPAPDAPRKTMPFAEFTRLLALEKASLRDVSITCHNGKITLRNFDLAFEGMRSGCELRSLSLDDAFLRGQREQVVHNFTHRLRTLSYPPPNLQVLARHEDGTMSWWSAPYHYTAVPDKLFGITLETDVFGLKTTPTQWVEAQTRSFKTMFGASGTATRVVILDFDDTLADTREQQKAAWKFMLESERDALQLTEKTIPKTLKTVQAQVDANINANEILKAIAPHVTNEFVTAFREKRIAKRFDLIKEKVEIEAQVKKFLERAVENDIMVCVSSWSSARHIKEFVDSKGLPITYVLGFDTDLPGMHDLIVEKARHMLKLQGATGFPLSRFVYIGDADRDRDACREIGVRFLRFDPQGKDRLGETVISHFDDIFPLLEKNGRR